MIESPVIIRKNKKLFKIHVVPMVKEKKLDSILVVSHDITALKNMADGKK